MFNTLKTIIKYIVVIPAFLLSNVVNSQWSTIYKVISTTEIVKDGVPREIEIEMSVLNTGRYCLLESHFLNGNTTFTYSGQVASTLVDYDSDLAYSFDDKLRIIDSYILSVDTFVSTGSRINYNGYNCDIYQVKRDPAIKIYACKKLPGQMNPGIEYFHDGSIGGIVRIEIQRKSSKLVYQLIRKEKSKQDLTPYVKQASSSEVTPKDARSILGTSN